jgi:hypothetical protein
MKSHFLNLLVLFFLLTSTLVAVPPSPVHAANTWTVTNTDDSGSGSLRQAIGMAVNGDTIIFSGVSGTILLSSELGIYQSITITGPGSDILAVSGGDAVRVFRIGNDVNVSISGLTITHGKVFDDYGVGIFKGSSTLTLDQVVVSHNQALKSTSVGFGGGIANYGGTLIITNSSLSYNTANNMGGAIYNYFDTSLLMTNVVVDHNQVTYDSGGGLAIRTPNPGNTAQPVVLDKVSITDNTAASSSGAIYSDDSMTITNSLIAGNSTPGDVGGLWIVDSGTGTAPVTITITNSTITGNTAGSGAGGLEINISQASSSVTLNNNTIASNQITGSSNGGGIRVFGLGTTNIKNTIIAGNTSNGTTPDDCYGTFTSQDYNLIQITTNCTINGTTAHNITGVSAQLAALAQNGGPTLTMALMPASPAFDAGNPAVPGSGGNACASTDQRGVTRPKGLYCDIGAFEFFYSVFLPVIKR